LRDLVGEAYTSIWVSGEVQRLRPSRRGHHYFELIEKGGGDEVLAKLEAVAWRRDFERIRHSLAADGQELAEGHGIRCRCDLDFYPPFGRLQLVVREVDPTFSLGLLARRRRETLAALEAAGLLELNKDLTLPTLPLDVVLVTSADSAAYHDFVSTLGESGYGFRVLLVHATVQGQAAEGEIASALAAVSGLAADCVVLIRGGGSRTDLAVFDSRRVAEAVARCPLPVITGLGHQTDQSIADLVAHTALKTPTKAAERLIERLREADGAVAVVARELPHAARNRLGEAREWLGAVERGLGLARFRLRAATDRRHGLADRLAGAARRRLSREAERSAGLAPRLRHATGASLARQTRSPDRVAAKVVAASRVLLRQAGTRLEGQTRLVRQLAPERTLERGFTITRDGAGRVIKEAGRLRRGDRLVTSFADGETTSRVESSRVEAG
jgi:exodeoxyribonuclease VII large subunit